MRLLCIAMFMGLASAAMAQSNYHEGYIIKNGGDTLKGFIDYREWAKCPTAIDFKVNKADQQILKFDPHTIKKFQVNGRETYLSYQGMVSNDRTRFPDLESGLDSGKKQDTIFLRQIASGKHLTLLFHRDELKSRLFISEGSGLPVELIYNQYYGPENQVIEKNTYKGQLIYYIHEFMPQNEKLNSLVQESRYRQEDLEPIISAINTDSLSVTSQSNYRLFAGLTLNSISTKFHDVTMSPPLSINSATWAPQANIGVDLFVNPNVQKLIFRTELSLSYINVSLDNFYGSGSLQFSQYSAMVTPQLLLNVYNKDNFKMYLDAGIRFNFSGYKASYTYFDWASSWASLPVLQVGLSLDRRTEFSVTYIGYSTYTHDVGYFNLMSQSLGLGFRYLIGGR
jgi:hypothetical protein